VILYDKCSKPNVIEPSTNGQVQSLLNSAVLLGISQPVIFYGLSILLCNTTGSQQFANQNDIIELHPNVGLLIIPFKENTAGLCYQLVLNILVNINDQVLNRTYYNSIIPYRF
jgi:hypothetical protein